jgi:four helix bundle protein
MAQHYSCSACSRHTATTRESAARHAAKDESPHARRTTRDDVHFVVVALGSASEVRYLLGLARRLGFLEVATASALEARYGELVRSLEALVRSLDSKAWRPEPGASNFRPKGLKSSLK